MPTAEHLRDGKTLSRGAVRLHEALRDVAADVARHRAYTITPDAITYHLPAVALAVALGYTERHLARLADELADAGLIAHGAHAQRVGLTNRWSGTLWKVSMKPGTAPRIRADEWRHKWAPGFSADYYGKSGAAAEMSGLQNHEAGTEQIRAALARRAAVADGISPPLSPSPDIRKSADLYGIADRLPELLGVHPGRRAALVTEMADDLVAVLADPGRRAQWAGVLWRVIDEENRLQPAIGHFAAQLHRLAADLREGAPWRSPGAVLASRLA